MKKFDVIFYEKENVSGIIEEVTIENESVHVKRRTPDMPTYYFKINDRCEFIPCYRKSDDKPGMYDLITKQFFINQGEGEFLVGPNVIDSISPLMVAWRRIMMAAASVAKKLTKLIATSSTGMVSFDTNVEMPTKITCEFSPVQEGTGDPSPDNVRPISGWTGFNITHAHKNLLDQSKRKYVE